MISLIIKLSGLPKVTELAQSLSQEKNMSPHNRGTVGGRGFDLICFDDHQVHLRFRVQRY